MVCKLSSVQQYYLILDSTSLLLLVVHGPTSKAFIPTAFITSAMETEDVRIQYCMQTMIMKVWKLWGYPFMIPLSYLQENIWATSMCQPSVCLMLADVTARDIPGLPPLHFYNKQTMKAWKQSKYAQTTVCEGSVQLHFNRWYTFHYIGNITNKWLLHRCSLTDVQWLLSAAVQ